ncbi:MAG: glycosyltransferase family 4 protein [Desulfobaccales bacterium]
MKNLRICLDARILNGSVGGVQQVITGLAGGLSSLTDGSEEYFFLCYENQDEWLRPYIKGPCGLLHVPYVSAPGWKTWLKSYLPVVKSIRDNLIPLFGKRTVPIPKSDGTIERSKIDIMHFTYQLAFLTHIPSIYHPHDLQHIHLKNNFTPRERLVREILYRTYCRQAKMVAVSSYWVKKDLMVHYSLPTEVIKVVPLAPPLTVYPQPSPNDIAKVRDKYSLPESFIFYPAQTWAHKNHLGLLEALVVLKNKYGLVVPFVSTGKKNEYYKIIRKRIDELNLNDQVYFLDFVDDLELYSLYKMCRCVVIPTKYEAASFPLWEAFFAGVPVACSNITSLPEEAGDAALLFNPDQPEEIAQSIFQLWDNEPFRNLLVERGKQKVSSLSWERTARIFRAHYRRIMNCSFTEEDRKLLEEGSNGKNCVKGH